ncbi:MAG: hypothetical protein GX596_04560 [Propionibacterium sp.]|nr:hypothetical protein [Propionibacterium sp.]
MLSATMHGEMLAQFDGLPAPRVRHTRPARARVARAVPTTPPPAEREPTPGIGRRAVIVGGGLVAVIFGGLVLQDIERDSIDADFAVTEAVPVEWLEGIDVAELDRVIAALQDRGFTRLAEFHAAPNVVQGAATDHLRPELLVAFESLDGGTLLNPWQEDSFAGATVAIDEFRPVLTGAFDAAAEHFEGEAGEVMLWWDEAEPVVVVVHGDERGILGQLEMGRDGLVRLEHLD